MADSMEADGSAIPQPPAGSNHSYNESFSRSRLSTTTSMDAAATDDTVEEEPDLSWLGEDDGLANDQEDIAAQSVPAAPAAPVVEDKPSTQSHPAIEPPSALPGAANNNSSTLDAAVQSEELPSTSNAPEPAQEGSAPLNDDFDAWLGSPVDAHPAPTQPAPTQLDAQPASTAPNAPASAIDSAQEDTPIQNIPEQPAQLPVRLTTEVSDTSSLPEPVKPSLSVIESPPDAPLEPRDEPHVALNPEPAASTEIDSAAQEVASIEREIAAEPEHTAAATDSSNAEPPADPAADLFDGEADDSWLAESSIEPSATLDAHPEVSSTLDDVDSSVVITRPDEAVDGGPDFGDTTAFEAEWSQVVPAAAPTDPVTEAATESTEQVEEPSTIEDEWSKAFADDDDLTADAVTDDPWAALGNELDDVGFLEDEPDSATEPPSTLFSQPAANPYAPSTVQASTAQSLTPNLASNSPLPSPYAPMSVQSQQPPQATSTSTPLKFFEDLPTGRPLPARRPKPQAPVLAPTSPPPALAAAPPPQARPPPQHSAPPPAGGPPGAARSISSQYGSFVPPPRQELFPPQPSVAPPVIPAALPTNQPPSVTSARYSPAPVVPASPAQPAAAKYAMTAPTQTPPSTSRYSPAAPITSASTSAASPYTPAASVTSPPPNAYDAPPTQAQAFVGSGGPLAPPPKQNARYSPAPPATSSASQYSAAPPQQQALPQSPPSQPSSQQSPLPPPPSAKPPPRAYSPTSAAPGGPPPAHRFAPRTSSPLAYAHGSGQNLDTTLEQATPETADARLVQSSSVPPRRTKTSSPEAGRIKVSALTRSLTAPLQPQPQQVTATGHTAEPDESNYIKPQDETAMDPLQRWKGAPILRWGANGTITTTFPSRTPRYGGGQTAPMIKSASGVPRIRKCTEAIPELASLDSFPGPLKAKGKKKELVAWLSTYIETLQRDQSHSEVETMDARIGERTLLWQIMKILVEHDGKLSGDPSVDLAVRQVLAPEAETAGLSGAPSQSGASSESLNPDIIEGLGQSLLRGDREKAVWHAVDNRMWAHAMLISSTMNPTVWKQVAQEFVRKEVRNARDGNHSMAALYNVFAGNHDESIDELVPVSARAGFHMVSSEGSSQQQNALDGLNKWRETLGLILSNRSNEDEKAILALGKLLAGYGRIEAAHICYLFAKSVVHFSGADDAQANFSLVGAALAEGDKTFDLDNVILSEIYEFGLSLGPGSTPAYYVPHLQSYKLRHAFSLAENGSRSKALQYCEAIASAIKSTTKMSLYYHPLLVSSVDDLAKRLAQTPKDGSSSWMARPSIEKVSGSMWARFNSFVAGDDGGDAASTGSAAQSDGEIGPFGRVAGTPSISRTNSVTDMFGMPSSRAQSIPPNMNSRYAPASASDGHSPQSGSPYAPGAAFQRNGMYNEARVTSEPAMQGQQYGYHPSSQAGNFGAPSYGDSYNPASHAGFSQDPIPPIQEEPHSTAPQYGSPTGSSVDMSSNPYAPSPALSFAGSAGHADDGNVNGFMAKPNGFPKRSTSYGPPPAVEESANGYEPSTPSYQPQQSSYDPSGGYQPSPAADYAPPSGGYDPSEGGSYQPPQSTGGYQPYQPEPDSPVDTKPRKKGIMDDDDDDGFSAPKPSAGNSKAENDRKADEAFRRAAEEDAKRDAAAKEARKSGSWFGGWLGNKKDPNAPVVHKAKLGEENSFVFDEATKKWVNKKAGADNSSPAAAAATPPPPRAGPPMGGPPSSRNVTPSGPPIGLGMSTPAPGPAPGPPSRICTPGSSGVPPALQHVAGLGGAVSTPPSSGPPSRPATSMSNASSIDDLLGAPAPRKGGTVKKGKKGGRYVDIMAK